MQIYLIRHAIAEDRATWDVDDHLRPLTSAGIKRMKQVARGLRTLDISLDALFTSPFVRARETAEIVAQGLKFGADIEELEALEPDGVPSDLLPHLNRVDDQGSVGLVGHEPHISRTISYFLCGSYSAYITVKKGGVAVFEARKPLQSQRMEFKWLMQPKHLVAIGK